MNVLSYISGYVDGEGCFCISFQPSKRHRFGWEVRPSFSVSQNADRSEVLTIIKHTFQCGTIRPDRSDKTLKYEVRNISDLITKVIPHFKVNPLLSSKQRDFELFESVCFQIFQGRHLERDSLKEIVSVVFKMNPAGKRKYSEGEILKSLYIDEGIVYATGNSG